MKFQQLRRLFLDTGDFKLIVYSLQETDNCPYLAGVAHQRASPDGSGGRGGPFPLRCRGSARGLSSKGACSMRADCFTMNWLPRRTTGCSSRSISSRSWRSRCRTRTKSCGMTGASFQNMLSLRKIRANLRRRQLILSILMDFPNDSERSWIVGHYFDPTVWFMDIYCAHRGVTPLAARPPLERD